MPANSPTISTHELFKSFPSRAGTVEAVRGVSLEVEAGEIFGLLGPNGAGKTTTMRMLTTLLPSTPARPRWQGSMWPATPNRCGSTSGT